MDSPACSISFVIPAYNEASLLAQTLTAIRRAASIVGESHELIVVDDGSTDGTPHIAATSGARVVPVQYRQISRTRNAGAKAARGQFLFFVDADTIITPEVVRAALKRLREGCVGGGAVFRFDNAVRPLGHFAELMVATVLKWMRLASGCFVFCRRDAFERVGGFDESLFAAEEWALSRALKRLGAFSILNEPVITSGRKLQQHRAREVLSLLLRSLRGGGVGNTLRNREMLEFWYKPKHR